MRLCHPYFVVFREARYGRFHSLTGEAKVSVSFPDVVSGNASKNIKILTRLGGRHTIFAKERVKSEVPGKAINEYLLKKTEEKMKRKFLDVFLVGVGLFLVSDLMWAHHSNALVDKDKLITLTGKVTNFEFVNPHVAIYFLGKDAQGNQVEWFSAGAGPQALRKDAGWNNKTFKAGDEILVQGHQNKDGRPIMAFRGIYRCNTGEMVTLDRGNETEYRTRVEIPKLEPASVREMCAKGTVQGVINPQP